MIHSEYHFHTSLGVVRLDPTENYAKRIGVALNNEGHSCPRTSDEWTELVGTILGRLESLMAADAEFDR